MTIVENWDRYEVARAVSLAPLFRSRGSGIYVLEFAGGEYYVGKTTRAAQRFATHVRRWGDVAAILFADVPDGDLDRVERATIAERRAAGWQLRNIKHNPGHTQPSSLDDVLPVTQQRHWALGHADYDVAAFAAAAVRDVERPTKLTGSIAGSRFFDAGVGVADVVLYELASVIEMGIPEAVVTEGDYWTITDYPSTAGGRFATLNVGDMEVAYFPRWPLDGSTLGAVLNVASGHALPSEIAGGWVEREVDRYRASGLVDQVIVPLGRVAEALQQQQVLTALRELVLALMRSSTSAKFARWHSEELARRAYAMIVDVHDDH